MLFDEEGNQPCLSSKSQTLCNGPLHGSVIWDKHMDAHNGTIFGMMVFLRAVGLGKDRKIIKIIFNQDQDQINFRNFWVKNNFEKIFWSYPNHTALRKTIMPKIASLCASMCLLHITLLCSSPAHKVWDIKKSYIYIYIRHDLWFVTKLLYWYNLLFWDRVKKIDQFLQN